jgi:hypothetical protein
MHIRMCHRIVAQHVVPPDSTCLAVNDIGDDGARMIAQTLEFNTSLVAINLAGTWLTDKSAKAVDNGPAELPSLSVFVAANRIN